MGQEGPVGLRTLHRVRMEEGRPRAWMQARPIPTLGRGADGRGARQERKSGGQGQEAEGSRAPGPSCSPSSRPHQPGPRGHSGGAATGPWSSQGRRRTCGAPLPGGLTARRRGPKARPARGHPHSRLLGAGPRPGQRPAAVALTPLPTHLWARSQAQPTLGPSMTAFLFCSMTEKAL